MTVARYESACIHTHSIWHQTTWIPGTDTSKACPASQSTNRSVRDNQPVCSQWWELTTNADKMWQWRLMEEDGLLYCAVDNMDHILTSIEDGMIMKIVLEIPIMNIGLDWETYTTWQCWLNDWLALHGWKWWIYNHFKVAGSDDHYRIDIGGGIGQPDNHDAMAHLNGSNGQWQQQKLNQLCPASY